MVYCFFHLTSVDFTFFPLTDIFSTNMIIIFQRTKMERGNLGNDQLVYRQLLKYDSYEWRYVLLAFSLPRATKIIVFIRFSALGPVSRKPRNFSGPLSHSTISNLMITELFYSHIFNMNRGSLHTRSFRRIHFSVFTYR